MEREDEQRAYERPRPRSRRGRHSVISALWEVSNMISPRQPTTATRSGSPHASSASPARRRLSWGKEAQSESAEDAGSQAARARGSER